MKIMEHFSIGYMIICLRSLLCNDRGRCHDYILAQIELKETTNLPALYTFLPPIQTSANSFLETYVSKQTGENQNHNVSVSLGLDAIMIICHINSYIYIKRCHNHQTNHWVRQAGSRTKPTASVNLLTAVAQHRHNSQNKVSRQSHKANSLC